MVRALLIFLFALSIASAGENKLKAQEKSIAREWNEILLGAITRDFARPTIHARNLHHVSMAMHDAWAACKGDEPLVFLGQTHGGFHIPFVGFSPNEPLEDAIERAMSYACYRLITHRFGLSPGVLQNLPILNSFMQARGYDVFFFSEQYQNGNAAALGNYIASQMIQFGHQDGANEIGSYNNLCYQPVNPPLIINQPGNPGLVDLNRWQPLTIEGAIDQAGNPVEATLPFLSPEWGNVQPYALSERDKSIKHRDGKTFQIYLDPGSPIFLDSIFPDCEDDQFKLGFAMVSIWQRHLDPRNPTYWDISPGAMGNTAPLSPNWNDFLQHYDYFEGGNKSKGHSVNPITGTPYEPQLVRRGDFARVVAEYWADGPASETPPGHWFSLLNYSMDHPLFERKWMGKGAVLSALDYDVKAYMVLGAAMHDAAIAAWSVKGYYDYIRPVSAIRGMSELGQCSDPEEVSYHPLGLPLLPGYIDIVRPLDSLAGANLEHVGKVKLNTWRGPTAVLDTRNGFAGAGWILAENWWPYQAPGFVTPPFAGFVSGHSTFSRAGAEILTQITGSPYFPGGLGEFVAEKDEFLEFETGPSEDIRLQWATYRDASDQSSLSRIWGGIHPPVDDIPGRIMGFKAAYRVLDKYNSLQGGSIPQADSLSFQLPPINLENMDSSGTIVVYYNMEMNPHSYPLLRLLEGENDITHLFNLTQQNWLDSSSYVWTLQGREHEIGLEISALRIQVYEGVNAMSIMQKDTLDILAPVTFDTRRPSVLSIYTPIEVIKSDWTAPIPIFMDIRFDESMDTNIRPEIFFSDSSGNPFINDLFQPVLAASLWLNDSTYHHVFTVKDTSVYVPAVHVTVSQARDAALNEMKSNQIDSVLILDLMPTAALDLNVVSSISLSPNPAGAGSQIAIKLPPTLHEPVSLQMMDMQGKVHVHNLHTLHPEGFLTLSLPSSLLPGIYLVQLNTHSESYISKLIVY